MINVTSDTNVTPFIAWSTYTACSLHFKEDSAYDAFKFNFKGPRLSREKFEVHKLRYTFEKLAREVTNRNILIEYFVANIISGVPWIHDMNWDVHSKWCGLLQRFDYDFKSDLNKLNAPIYDDLFRT